MSMNKIKAPAYDITYVPFSGTTSSNGNVQIPESSVPATSYIIGVELHSSSASYYTTIGKSTSNVYYLHVTGGSGSAQTSASVSGTLAVLTPRS